RRRTPASHARQFQRIRCAKCGGGRGGLFLRWFLPWPFGLPVPAVAIGILCGSAANSSGCLHVRWIFAKGVLVGPELRSYGQWSGCPSVSLSRNLPSSVG